VRDLLWLRAISIVGSIAAILYNYFAPASPLWLVIGWNAAFALVNIVQIGLSMREQAMVKFTEEEKDLFETLFQAFTPVEFMKIMRLARWEDRDEGVVLTKEGEPVENLMMIYNGVVDISVRGKKVSSVKDGRFVAEMSFISGSLASATTTTAKKSRMVCWNRDALKALLNRNPTLRFGFQAVLTNDLYKKLQREGATTHTNLAFPS
jgi:CRP-like cAMP-binding protein